MLPPPVMNRPTDLRWCRNKGCYKQQRGGTRQCRHPQCQTCLQLKTGEGKKGAFDSSKGKSPGHAATPCAAQACRLRMARVSRPICSKEAAWPIGLACDSPAVTAVATGTGMAAAHGKA
eukprot:485443-Pelagomonas_calceolata.AAC.1